MDTTRSRGPPRPRSPQAREEHAADASFPQSRHANLPEELPATSQGARTRKDSKKGPMLTSAAQSRVNPRTTGNHSYDYEKKYEDDAWGEEWAPNARVWRVYSDEAQLYDAERTEGWKETLDAFLVFVGLFSAVGATFLGFSLTALQPDYGQITASLIMEQIALQRAIADGISPQTVAASPFNVSSHPTPGNSDLWVNGLWFTSLALSLSAAIVAVLIKQWIHQYLQFVSGPPIEQVRQRHFRFTGLRTWKVPVIIGLLPLVLHAAVFLYLIGLTIFLVPLSRPIGIVVGAVTSGALIVYTISSVLPLLYPGCPYKTPISIYAHDLLFEPLSRLLKLTHDVCSTYYRACRESKTFKVPIHTWWHHVDMVTRRPLQARETDLVKALSGKLELSAVSWLYAISSNPSISTIALQSLSAVPVEIGPTVYQHALKSLPAMVEAISGVFATQCSLRAGPHPIITERMGRALARFSQDLDRTPSARRNPLQLVLRKEISSTESNSAFRLGLIHLGQYQDYVPQFEKRAQWSSSSFSVPHALLDYHPSIWCGFFSAPFRRNNILGEHDGYDSTAVDIIKLFGSIDFSYIRYGPLDSKRRVGYIKWSLVIRYLSSCVVENSARRRMDALYTEYARLDSRGRCTLEHQRVTVRILCHVVRGISDVFELHPVISSAGGEAIPLRTLQASYDCIGSWLLHEPSIFSSFDSATLREVCRVTLDILVVGLQRGLIEKPEFDKIWPLLVGPFCGAEDTFGQRDFELFLEFAGYGASSPPTLLRFDQEHREDSTTLVKCLDHFLSRQLFPLQHPPHTPLSNQWIPSTSPIQKDINAVHLLLSALWADFPIQEVAHGKRAVALMSYVNCLVRAASSEDFRTSCITVLQSAVKDLQVCSTWNGANLYLCVFTEKLKQMYREPINIEFYQKMPMIEDDEIIAYISDPSPERELAVGLAESSSMYLLRPMKNDEFRHIFVDPLEERLPTFWSELKLGVRSLLHKLTEGSEIESANPSAAEKGSGLLSKNSSREHQLKEPTLS